MQGKKDYELQKEVSSFINECCLWLDLCDIDYGRSYPGIDIYDGTGKLVIELDFWATPVDAGCSVEHIENFVYAREHRSE